MLLNGLLGCATMILKIKVLVKRKRQFLMFFVRKTRVAQRNMDQSSLSAVFTKMTQSDKDMYLDTSKTLEHRRALLRRMTLYYRGIYGDKTVDGIADPTALYVLVSGKYRHILLRHLYREIISRKGARTVTWHYIRGVRYNQVYNTINVMVDGFPGYSWFYLPKKYYDDKVPVLVGDVVGMQVVDHFRLYVVECAPALKALQCSIFRGIDKE